MATQEQRIKLKQKLETINLPQLNPDCEEDRELALEEDASEQQYEHEEGRYDGEV